MNAKKTSVHLINIDANVKFNKNPFSFVLYFASTYINSLFENVKGSILWPIWIVCKLELIRRSKTLNCRLLWHLNNAKAFFTWHSNPSTKELRETDYILGRKNPYLLALKSSGSMTFQNFCESSCRAPRWISFCTFRLLGVWVYRHYSNKVSSHRYLRIILVSPPNSTAGTDWKFQTSYNFGGPIYKFCRQNMNVSPIYLHLLFKMVCSIVFRIV